MYNITGYFFSLDDVELVDLSQVSQSCTKPADYPLRDEGMFAANFGNKILSCGGWETLGCFKYDPALNLWEPSPFALPERLAGGHSVQINTTHWWILGDNSYMFTEQDGFVAYEPLPYEIRPSFMMTLVDSNTVCMLNWVCLFTPCLKVFYNQLMAGCSVDISDILELGPKL